jgi:hypothetical protein
LHFLAHSALGQFHCLIRLRQLYQSGRWRGRIIPECLLYRLFQVIFCSQFMFLFEKAQPCNVGPALLYDMYGVALA